MSALVCVLLFFASLFLSEIMLRIFFKRLDFRKWRNQDLLYFYDPHFGWGPLPGTYETPEGRIVINELGLRGPRPPTEPPPGALRILVLGHSSSFGSRVPHHEPWPEVLQKILAERLPRPVEVINGSCPGYSSYQSLMRLRHQYLSLQPDLVIADHLWNDFKIFGCDDLESIMAKWSRHARKNEASWLFRENRRLDRLSDQSQLAARLRQLLARAHRRVKKNYLKRTSREIGHPYLTEVGVNFYRDTLQAIAQETNARGLPLYLVHEPLLLRPDNQPEELAVIHYDFVKLDHPTLLEAIGKVYRIEEEEFTRQGNVIFIDGNAAVPPDLLHFVDHVHLTPAGIAALAAAVAAAVVKNHAD